MNQSPNTPFSRKLRRLTLSAMLAALTCAATMVIQIPSPMNGYVHLGDTVVLLSAFLLGPVYGTAAAGIGSMLADVFTGYLHYAPGTFVIKGAVALIACLLYGALRKRKLLCPVSALIAGLAGEAVMTAGYFGYAALLLGNGLSAAASIPGNVVQGVFGTLAAAVVAAILRKVKFGGRSLVE